jgi:uncharacterized membrane protein YdcZ (DUF606 family)
MDLIFWIKVAGGAIGSSIAVVFKTGGDPWLKLTQRFAIGTVGGFISAPALIDYMGWTHTPDYWLASATIGGVVSYLALQLLFNTDLKAMLPGYKSPLPGKIKDE